MSGGHWIDVFLLNIPGAPKLLKVNPPESKAGKLQQKTKVIWVPGTNSYSL